MGRLSAVARMAMTCICSPFGEELVVDGVLSCQVRATLGLEEIAELCTSGDGFTELEVNRIWHDDRLLLHHIGQAEEVSDGYCVDAFEFAGAMAHEPSNDRPGVFFVPDIDVKEGGRDAFFA